MEASVVVADTKKCPKCAEDIRAAAIKCKHCGSELAPTGDECVKCKGTSLEMFPLKHTPGGMVALGTILIVFGVFGLPFFGLGVLGIVAGIVIMAVVKHTDMVPRCTKCKWVQPNK